MKTVYRPGEGIRDLSKLLRSLRVDREESVSFILDHNAISDLTPLAGWPITHLDIEDNFVTDLSPLCGMEIVSIWIRNNLIADVAPLATLPLLYLNGMAVAKKI